MKIIGTVVIFAACLSAIRAPAAGIEVAETAERISIATDAIEAAVMKAGYVSGVAAGSLLDRKTGARDLGFGLDIVDWLLEPGSDADYRAALPEGLPYNYRDLYHGNIAKRSVEGPQICTQAKALAPRVVRGLGFAAVVQDFTYRLAAPGRKAGSRWEQTLVFPEGKRYFVAADRVTTANASDALFLRIDMPGHIRHQKGDTFGEVYLSYAGRIPAKEFLEDFPPDARYRYVRKDGAVPRRFIRAYRVRDPRTGRDGPWLAGMTLDPAVVYDAWCHQRGYVCMIEEIGGRPVKPGDVFGAAYIVGWFDSIEEMEEVYDRHAGNSGLEAGPAGWKLLKAPAPAASSETRRPA